MESVQELQELRQPGARNGESTSGSEVPEASQQANEQSLPPCDRGGPAWRLLFTAFVFECLLWGFPLSFGVFQNYYSQLPQFQNDPYISVVGTVASGISYLAAPVMIPLVKRFAKYRRQMIWVGWPICLLSLVAGSFARSLATLIFTQGIMYGVGFIIFYYPILSMVNEYWISRRGMAYGLLCSASGVSGAAMPFCIEVLLHKYGYPTTLRAIAVGLFVLTGPLIPLLKGRTPETETNVAGRTDWSFLKSGLFWWYSASNLAMGLGYFFPSLYLPSYASANGYSSVRGALLLAIMSIAQVLGQLTFGYLSDKKVNINLLTLSSTAVAGAAVYAGWGLGHTFEVMAVFSIIYGFFAAGYTALWARMGTSITSEPSAAFAAFGLLNAQKGIGNVLAGPIGGALVMPKVSLHAYGARKYEAVVLFTGTCMFVSAAAVLLCCVDGGKVRSVSQKVLGRLARSLQV